MPFRQEHEQNIGKSKQSIKNSASTRFAIGAQILSAQSVSATTAREVAAKFH
jgi:hypothetical protein